MVGEGMVHHRKVVGVKEGRVGRLRLRTDVLILRRMTRNVISGAMYMYTLK